MSDSNTPWHLWVVGLVSLLWNGFGGYDYTMTQTRNMDYLESMGYPESGLAYLGSFPAWAEGGWALGAWGALLGSILLLLKNRYAVWAFVVSTVGLVVTTIFEATADVPAELQEMMPGWFPLLLWAIALFLLWYAWDMRKKGVLR